METSASNIFADPERRLVRSHFLFTLGSHLASCGFLLLGIYYAALYLSSDQGQELLEWFVPTAQGCCFFAAILLAGGLLGREQEDEMEETEEPVNLIEVDRESTSQFEKLKSRALTRITLRFFSAEIKPVVSLLKKLNKCEFNELAENYFREIGFRIAGERSDSHGVDFFLYTEDDYTPIAVNSLLNEFKPIDLAVVREHHRMMMLAGAVRGVLIVSGEFAEEATDYALEKGIELINVKNFAGRLLTLPRTASDRLFLPLKSA